jgi:predicted RNase H-like HicB family nuclease
MTRQLTAIIEREGDGFVALCPEVDIASQGNSLDEARKNLQEALELFFETASPEEIKERLHHEVYVTEPLWVEKPPSHKEKRDEEMKPPA